MDEIFDRIRAAKINHKYLAWSLIFTEILGILTLIWYLKTPLTKKFFEEPAEAYSIITLNPDKRYLASQGDYLAGKAIPNTLVKVLITPGNSIFSLRADGKGDWRFQIPEAINKEIFRFTFGNFDVNNKLVTFRSYKFRIESNNSLIKNTDKLWRRLTAAPINSVFAQENQAKNFDYQLHGLPLPNSTNELTEDEIYRLEKYFLPYAYPAAKKTGADWRLMAMWIQTEAFLTNYMDNCLDGNKAWGEDADANQNTPCTGWSKNGSPNWQVGWGIMPHHWVDKLPEAIAVMRPGETIQQIGQRVINESYEQDRYPKRGIVIYKPPSDPINNPEFFPDDVTLEQIISGSKPVGEGTQEKPCPRSESDLENFNPDQDPVNCDMRQLLGILLKDPAISAYFLALMWKDIESKGNLPDYFATWGPELNSKGQTQNPYRNSQRVSNTIASIENAASGLDLEAIAQGPRLTVPYAVSHDHQGPIQIEAIISENGQALDDSALAERNLNVAKIVIPNGTNPVDFGYGANPENYTYQPNSQNNVKGVTSFSEITLDAGVLQSPDEYQTCIILEAVGYEVIADYYCIPLIDIIDPQIPLDNSDTLTPPALEEIPDSSILEEQSYCQPQEWTDSSPYSCENGYACYNRWKIHGGNQCAPQPNYGEDGNHYFCIPDDSCNPPAPSIVTEESTSQPVALESETADSEITPEEF